MKTKFLLITSILLLPILAGSALAIEYKQNIPDKEEKYTLLVSGKAAGEIYVKATFVEEPVIAPFEITVDLKCNNQAEPVNLSTFNAFDYGSLKIRTRIAEYNSVSGKLTVFFTKAKVNPEGYAKFSSAESLEIDLKGKCSS